MIKTEQNSPLSVGALKAIKEAVPHPKWQRVKLPEGLFELPMHPVTITVDHTDSGAVVYPLKPLHLEAHEDLPLEKEALETLWAMGLEPKRSGLGLAFSSWTLSEFNHGALIVAKANQASKIVISHGVPAGSSIGHYLVVAEEGSRLELVLDYAEREGREGDRSLGEDRRLGEGQNHVQGQREGRSRGDDQGEGQVQEQGQREGVQGGADQSQSLRQSQGQDQEQSQGQEQEQSVGVNGDADQSQDQGQIQSLGQDQSVSVKGVVKGRVDQGEGEAQREGAEGEQGQSQEQEQSQGQEQSQEQEQGQGQGQEQGQGQDQEQGQVQVQSVGINGGAGLRAMLYSQVSVLARAGSQTRIVNVQRLGEVAGSFQSVCTEIEEGASVVLGDIQLGSGFKASSASQRLAGRHAQAKTYGLYFTGPSEQADLQYTHTHVGKRSEGHILAKGAMSDQSKKVFRGNLVFDRGSTGSVGKEEEFVMLLSEQLKSDSLPGLFCEEDDVIGEHAASIGQVDTDKLFYLMSRGFRESAARKLLVHAAFEDVLVKLEVPFVSTLVGEVIERAFERGEGL